jgi:hypothetical protein
MAGYVELGEVRTWYDEKGGGEPLVLMHPGGADARAWAPNIDALAARFHVFTPERRGHGRTPDVEGLISYELMAQDTIAFLEGVVAGPAHLVERGRERGAGGRRASPRPCPPPGPDRGCLPPRRLDPRRDRSGRVPRRVSRAGLRRALARGSRPLPGGRREAGARELGGADARRRGSERGGKPGPGHARRRR